MALTCAQICTLAQQISKSGAGYTSQAGQMLNMILSDLAQTYDFDVGGKGVFYFNFNPSLISVVDPNVVPGSGPYPLPSDYLRAVDQDAVFWTLLGVPYPLIPIDLSEFDMTVQQAGNMSYPYLFATDMSTSPPGAYVWPAPSGAYPVTVRYRKQPADITTPETSTTVPWFPNSTYLVTRLAGELCKLTGDDRWQAMLGDGEFGAQGVLDRYLKMKDDSSNRAKTVKLDRRRFGRDWNRLPNTKTIGW